MTAPQHPQRCETCESFHEVKRAPEYRCSWNCCFVHPKDECICTPSHHKENHSSSPAAAPVPCHTCGNPGISMCPVCYGNNIEQIRQQAAAEERKKVLDAIARWVESHRCYRDDGSLEWTYGLHADELDKIIEYLRREGEQR